MRVSCGVYIQAALHAKLLLGAKRAVAAAIWASQAARLGPYAAAAADPKVAACSCSEAVKGGMEPFLDAAFDAEAAKGNLAIDTRDRIALGHNVAISVNPSMLWLQHVKVVCRAHLEADVALKISGLVVMALLAGTVLGEVLSCAHHKLSLVSCISHALRINSAVEVTVHGGEVDERLVVHARVHHALNIFGEPLNTRRHVCGRGKRSLPAMFRRGFTMMLTRR